VQVEYPVNRQLDHFGDFGFISFGVHNTLKGMRQA
jgi:hypothetical protein